MPHSAPHTPNSARRFAIIGAGMAGVTCARTLLQAGHSVTLFEREGDVGGRMASLPSPFGSLDAGAQYFTVRDQRFERALQAMPELQRPWSVSSVRTVDAQGERVGEPAAPQETHWVGQPSMQALVQHWAAPLHPLTGISVERLERQPGPQGRWTLHTHAAQSYPDFDAVLCALPAAQTLALLQASQLESPLVPPLHQVQMTPCWTLLLAYPQAAQPDVITLGPQWNAARSTHPRIAWMARESSKPARGHIERWTIHANAQWSQEHWNDSPQRIQDKLTRAFAEITGIHTQAAWSQLQRWSCAQTTRPLGQTHLWDSAQSLGACGDWCLGRRVENAFVSGLELALAVA